MHGEDALEVFPRLAVAGKLLWDIGNFRAAIDGPITETLRESLQRKLPDTQVLKGMNFVSAQVMGHPERLDGDHTVFVAGNNADAKAVVSGILQSFGWTDVFDLDDLTACRAMASLAPMWIRLNERLENV